MSNQVSMWKLNMTLLIWYMQTCKYDISSLICIWVIKSATCDCRILKSDVHNFSFSFFLFQLNVHYHSRIFAKYIRRYCKTGGKKNKKTKKKEKKKLKEVGNTHLKKTINSIKALIIYIYINSWSTLY